MMENIIEEAIEESWIDFKTENNITSNNGYNAHKHGWKEGYEWILTKLIMSGKISKETLKEFMDKLK